MIVSLILRGDWVTEQQGSSYIVANPVPSVKTYCLPLVVCNFGIEKPSPFDEPSAKESIVSSLNNGK